MNTRQTLLLLSLLPTLFASGCMHSHNDPVQGSSVSTPAATTAQARAAGVARVRFNITGMHCGGCASGIRSELLRTSGVSKAVVNFKKGEAIVTYDAGAVDATALMKVVSEAGYQATLKGR